MKLRIQFVENREDTSEKISSSSPVVSGQSLTGAEIHRRMSAGLPVGCAVRSFNEINPYIEKFSIYDALGQFRLRHGLVDASELENVSLNSENVSTENQTPSEETKE